MGLALFVASVFDLLSDLCLLIILLKIGEYLLFFCAMMASAAVIVSTLQLDYATFGEISKSDLGGASVVRTPLIIVAVVVSCVRFQSLEVLRLKVKGQELLAMPMEQKHYWFIQQGATLGVFASFPHFLVAISVLRDGGHTAHYGSLEHSILVFSLFFSAGSILMTALSHERVQRLACMKNITCFSARGGGEGDMYDEFLSGSEKLSGSE